MQTITVTDDSDTAVWFCPRCGAKTLAADQDIRVCPHLVYVSSSETPGEVWFDAAPRLAGDDEDDEDTHEVLTARYPGDDVVLFELGNSPPAALVVYVAYRLSS